METKNNGTSTEEQKPALQFPRDEKFIEVRDAFVKELLEDDDDSKRTFGGRLCGFDPSDEHEDPIDEFMDRVNEKLQQKSDERGGLKKHEVYAYAFECAETLGQFVLCYDLARLHTSKANLMHGVMRLLGTM